jgi:serine/threonine-protein kinase
MGAVYRAQQLGLGREVALKVLKRRPNVTSDVVARFEREARALSALTHPNAVRVYDFGATEDGQLFLAMELLHGELAAHHLAERGALDTVKAISWTQAILRSLQEAHEKGIIHRDIKPENIFVTRGDASQAPTVKLLDFGIAKAVEGEHALDQFETQDGTVFGTPRYMSPEQAQGRPLDHRSDLYAAGIVLYELLAGTPPFADKDAVVVMAQHIRELPPPLQRAAPDKVFPPSLPAVLERALAKAPDARFQSAHEFEQALEVCRQEALVMDPTQTRSRALWLRLLATLTPRVRAATAAALAMLALAIGLATGTSERAPTALSDAATANAKRSDGDGAPVLLVTQPEGANVWQQGRFVGLTPLALDVPAGESVRVRVSKQGFQTQNLDLTAGEHERRLVLKRTAEASTGAHEQAGRPSPERRQGPRPSEAYEKF